MGRILKSVDFSSVLSRPSRSRSAHFALHYSSASPASRSKASQTDAGDTLSTGDARVVDRPVDILWRTGEQPVRAVADATLVPSQGGDGARRAGSAADVWFGLVVPKRHAKRSVTRTLMKRQIRVAFEDIRGRLEPGMWVVRLKAPFGKSDFPSASSAALKQAVRDELSLLMDHGVRRRDRAS
jgi:ribonuclease P protein component